MFTLKTSSTSCGRKGILSAIPGKANVNIETPALMMYTKGGSIPHLTHEVLTMLTTNKLILLNPLVSTFHMNEGVKSQGDGFLTFSGMNEHILLNIFHDPCLDVRLGKFETDKMPLWTRAGKFDFDANRYMDIIENFKPNIYGVLSDNCTDGTSSKKRIQKSVDRSELMLKICVERHKNSNYLSKNSAICGVIVGGHSIAERNRFMKSLLKHADDLDGFILDGINHNGTQIENISFESIKDMVSSVTSLLPENKIRIVHGCWNPVTLLDLISNGWDLFDTTLPYLTTEKGCCLTFNFNVKQNNSSVYEIDLTEKWYKEDLKPVIDHCECLCCKKYTKAYIHHLLNTRELLANVLMMIHNLHHYMKYFETIRSITSKEDMSRLRALISEQFVTSSNNKDFKNSMSNTEKIKARKLSLNK